MQAVENAMSAIKSKMSSMNMKTWLKDVESGLDLHAKKVSVYVCGCACACVFVLVFVLVRMSCMCVCACACLCVYVFIRQPKS